MMFQKDFSFLLGDTTVVPSIPIRPIEIKAVRTTTSAQTQLIKPIRPIGYMGIGNAPSSSCNDIDVKQSIRESTMTIIANANVCPFKFNRYFMCLYCKHKSLFMSQLIEHLNTDHYNIDVHNVRKTLNIKGGNQPIKINIIDYTCRICNRNLSSFEDLKNHLVTDHRKYVDLKNDGVVPFKITDDSFICGRCDAQCDNYILLNRHMNVHYKNCVCDQCGKSFPSEDRLKSHANSHDSGSFPCEMCDKVYRTISAKRDHIKIAHLHTKKYKCTLCPEKFQDYYRKQKHLLTVHGVQRNTYTCGFCPKTFLASSNLKAHERLTHVKIQKYFCDHCNYHTYDKYALIPHMISHSDEKKFKCQVCKKSYTRKKTLTGHMRIHNNDRRFACQHCDRAFVQKCSLKGHMRTHHRDVENLEC